MPSSSAKPTQLADSLWTCRSIKDIEYNRNRDIEVECCPIGIIETESGGRRDCK